MVFAANGYAFSLITDLIGTYELRSGSREKGLVSEIISGAFAAAQIPLEEVQEYPWGIGQNLVLNGFKDGSYPHVWSENLQKDFIYSSEKIIDNSLKVFSLKESEIPYHHHMDFTGKKVGLVRGIRYSALLMHFLNKNATLVWSVDEKQNIDNLLKGEVDYSISDELLGRNYVEANKVNISKNRIKDISLYVIFNKNVDKKSIDEVDSALKTFKRTSQYRMILESYIGGN